ncbi:Na+/H+ antiporter subunit G [Devosia pacifica]|uniref:Na+/H+ antiporter subunit G n=1 Tax=Devosia pacifica TaxID=1335967 RepID=A0A918S8W2_9HYPH|nr:monovalent cation/H(+) antiporter subunit G [Devosia pacifica]GHA29533.1 Na+/H+ antiporter subunit G [Devosia pacifica]
MMDLAQYLAAALILLGAGFALVSAMGVLRLPDLYTRMHAASKAGSVGAGFILIAVAIVSFDLAVTLRAFAGIFFLLLTTPVASHLLARASYQSGYRPAESTVMNDLDAEFQTHS